MFVDSLKSQIDVLFICVSKVIAFVGGIQGRNVVESYRIEPDNFVHWTDN